MKKAVVFLALLSLVLPLFSSWYSSNQLGQKKGELDGFSSLGWVLYEDESSSVLYEDGKEIKRKQYSARGWTETTESGSERVSLNSDGLIERRIVENEEGRKEYNYFYSGAVLTGYNYSLDGTLVERVDYTTTKNGDLLYYKVLDEGIYLGDNYFVYEDGERLDIGVFTLEESVENTPTENGGYSEIRGGRVYEYDKNGRLIREEDTETKIEYTYLDDGTLSEKREEKENGVYVTTYSGGEEVISYFTSDGDKVTERRTLSDGSIEETRFIEGTARYVFIYDRDGKRIKEAYSL